MSEMMINNSLVKIKEHPPYLGDMEGKVLLNSLARATLDPKTGEYSFQGKLATEVPLDITNVKAITDIVEAGGLSDHVVETYVGVGVDQGVFVKSSSICLNSLAFTLRADLGCTFAQPHLCRT